MHSERLGVVGQGERDATTDGLHLRNNVEDA